MRQVLAILLLALQDLQTVERARYYNACALCRAAGGSAYAYACSSCGQHFLQRQRLLYHNTAKT